MRSRRKRLPPPHFPEKLGNECCHESALKGLPPLAGRASGTRAATAYDAAGPGNMLRSAIAGRQSSRWTPAPWQRRSRPAASGPATR